MTQPGTCGDVHKELGGFVSTGKAVEQLRNDEVGKPRFARAYGFALVTGALFLLASDQRIEAKLDVLLTDRGIDPAEISERVNRSLH